MDIPIFADAECIETESEEGDPCSNDKILKLWEQGDIPTSVMFSFINIDNFYQGE